MTVGLVLLAVLGLIGAFALLILDRNVPQEIWYLETTLAGAIAGTTVPRKLES